MAHPPASTVRDRVLEFLAEYGEKGYAVLRAAAESALSAGQRSVRLGDFSYREVVARLRAWGIEYNPSMLLRVLERDYGVIETSYRSSSQHWWRFIDLDATLEALELYEKGVNPTEEGEGDTGLDEDPEVALLRLQIASLNPYSLLEKLEKLNAKPRLTPADYAVLRSIAFNDLPAAVELVRRAEELGYEGEEVQALRRLLNVAARLASKLLRAGRAGRQAARSLMLLASTSGRGRSGGNFEASGEVPQ